jgi:spermidine synthase
MPRPWTLLEAVESPDGLLELRRRGERDFMISIDKRVLMTSTFTRSEKALAELGCAAIAGRAAPRVLIGGLGLGYTLRATLDALPSDAQVMVAELNPVVVRWCKTEVARLSGDALSDPRVEVVVGDVTDRIRGVAADPARPRFDAILFDLYVGPGAAPRGREDPLYGRAIVARAREALSAGGVFAVWGENPDPPFEARLRDARFAVDRVAVRGGGPAHAVVVAIAR